MRPVDKRIDHDDLLLRDAPDDEEIEAENDDDPLQREARNVRELMRWNNERKKLS